ncbi:RNA polymerase sigma factor [Winogradskyella haliclonae]|uniref:DNA-directed RNA polymerase sigma-70 factor n=1 Tax=Winogradskyella haliclonae TaxID=2048558 RepID=A0ABQ2C0C9_9FLAO|nr:sigma-70 family RNA polymerase sigma factor [Winogradskyella haliclonae]GGI57665.1 DNA-directed RNA polymerase sigma-70 factor [Winogradskyella haliclonae]
MTEQEFTKIYNSNASKVHRLCLGYASGNNELADEWLQETFIKVWNHRNSFKGKSAIDTWIYRIAVNICLGDLRKSRKSIPINEDLLSKRSNDEENDNDEKNIKQMYHCIDQLTEQNKALILLELENISQATIAQTVGLAHGTLRTRLSRIRKSLLKCIKNGK